MSDTTTATLSIVVVQHSADVPVGLLGEFFEENKISYSIVKIFENQALPTEGYSAIVSLGGIMGAYDEAEYPWLIEEKKWLRDNAARNVPILGICLGCQLLSDALGGKAYPASKGYELGFPEIKVEPASLQDPVFSHLPIKDNKLKYILCHGDTWDLPPNATLLAATDYCRQAFRLGSVLGVQFHPEANRTMFEHWAKGVRQRHITKGATPPVTEEEQEELLKQSESPELKEAAFALFDAWTKTITSVDSSPVA